MPAAVPDCIRADNCDQVTARLIVEAANIPTTEEAQALLHERGVIVIPDFVANSGANSWWWWTLSGVIGASADESFARVRQAMQDTVGRMLELSRDEHLTPRDAAGRIAEENLDRIVAEEAAGSRRVGAAR